MLQNASFQSNYDPASANKVNFQNDDVMKKSASIFGRGMSQSGSTKRRKLINQEKDLEADYTDEETNQVFNNYKAQNQSKTDHVYQDQAKKPRKYQSQVQSTPS